MEATPGFPIDRPILAECERWKVTGLGKRRGRCSAALRLLRSPRIRPFSIRSNMLGTSMLCECRISVPQGGSDVRPSSSFQPLTVVVLAFLSTSLARAQDLGKFLEQTARQQLR